MKIIKSDCSFEYLMHEEYPASGPDPLLRQLAAQSSAIPIGTYPGTKDDRPGTSFLWIGEDHHLNRVEVGELVVHLQRWLETGRLSG